MAALFQDHEIFVRTGGQVRFLHISARWQKRVALLAGGVLLAWGGITAAMLVNQALTASERSALAAQQAEVARSEARVAKYRGRIEETTAELVARQAQMEELVTDHFGQAGLPAEAPAADAKAAGSDTADKISALANDPTLPPEARQLAALEARQDRFARRLLVAVEQRSARAEAAVARLGLNPDAIVRSADVGRGGPLVPSRRGSADPLVALASALARMEALERTLVAVPSSNPADVMLMSSGFGYRRDPFTGAGAMHSGLDFKGPVGTPILAAAPGRVVHAGPKSGYGYTVEVDHGQGIMTRYAHLSGFTTQVGASVATGQQIGKMGSTGRSTGSHLHFEVRLNGVAVNPRRFLEANADVLKVKAVAGNRVGTRSN